MVRDLTKGKPISLILKFCLPLITGNLFQQFYNMVDSMVVGRFVGKDALSAVGSVGSLNFLVIGSVLGLCAGLTIPVAQSFGAGNYEKMRKYIANSIYLAVGIGAIITAVTVIFTDELLIVMNTPEEIFKDARDYIIIIFGGIAATILYNTLASLLRALGDSKTPLYFLIFSSILNIALDLLFVLKFSMGVKGVAIATVISQAVSGVLCLIYVKKNLYIVHFNKSEAKPDAQCCRKLLVTGLPMALQFSITAIGSVMLQSCVNMLGSDVIAAVTIAGKTQLMIVLPSETIGLTMATFCSQNLGARRLDRISTGVRQGMLLALGYSLMAIAIAWFGGEFISLLFIDKSETVVLGYVGEFLKTCSVFYPVLILIFVLRNSLQGLGFSFKAMTAGVFELFARGIMGYGFVMRYGFSAVRFANPVAWIAADIVLIPMFIYEMHKLKTNIEYLNKCAK